MSGNGVIWVASVACVLDSQTFASSDFVALHSSQELSTLASEHGTHDDLNAASVLEVSGTCKILGGSTRAVLVWLLHSSELRNNYLGG
jgi:hypothetical protein